MNKTTKTILDLLAQTYPNATCELDYETPLQLLIATVLSAQTTDRQVNKVTRVLFDQHPDLDSLLALSLEEIKDYIHSLGFFNAKAAHIYELLRVLKTQYQGVVPDRIEELVKLPGVGRKTANVVVSNAYGVPAIAVDTHVFRVSNRIGLVNEKTVEATEQALMKAIDPSLWSSAHHWLIFHGRYCCDAKKPQCERCPIAHLCAYYHKQKTGGQGK